jgi:hypothetical protein
LIACEQDCTDLWGGPDNIPNSGDEAIYDECGICDDYDFNDGVQPEYPYGSCDCNGEFGGPDGIFESGDEAFKDNCGICVGGSTGLIKCEQDCEGIWGGTFIGAGVDGIGNDACDVCGGNCIDEN